MDQTVSPDGSLLLLGNVVYDVHGRRTGSIDGYYGVWADDSRHLCAYRSQGPVPGGPGVLYLIEPGQRPRRVAQVGGYNPHGGPVVLRCSISDDEALIGDTFAGQIDGLSSVQLSTGHVTKPHWIVSDAQRFAAVSGNGRYRLVEGPATPLTISSNIVDARTNKVVGNVTGQPLAISWNGHLVVVLLNSMDIAVKDWQTGTEIWRSAHRSPREPGIVSSATVAARPLSDDLAVAVSALPGRNPQTAMLWLLAPGRRPTLLAPAVAAGTI